MTRYRGGLREKRRVAASGRRPRRWVCDSPADTERHRAGRVYTEREATIYTKREGAGRVTLHNP